MDDAIKTAAEFGVTAFLLVFVLTGAGYALWRLGNRIADAIAKSLERQSDTVDRVGDAIQKIGDLAAAQHVAIEQHSRHLEDIRLHVRSHSTALHELIHAASEAAPHMLAPEQQARVAGYLENAKRSLSKE